MRNKSRITALETQVSELNEQVAMLLEVMTRPERALEMPKPNNSDWRARPRQTVATKNRFRAWSKADVELAVNMREKGATADQVGKVLGRSRSAVLSMYHRYGLA
jgi:predicted RNase H-like nuclease (RuvC/YqgF family)